MINERKPLFICLEALNLYLNLYKQCSRALGLTLGPSADIDEADSSMHEDIDPLYARCFCLCSSISLIRCVASSAVGGRWMAVSRWKA
ncbi:hypothetical protein U1Q18_013138 [Sarracenia purpurea var. burkii]